MPPRAMMMLNPLLILALNLHESFPSELSHFKLSKGLYYFLSIIIHLSRPFALHLPT